MKPSKKTQHGAFMVILLIIIAALIGFAALALDVGRVLILRAEMQNAVDAAALAAAKELDGRPGARDRAVANARYALEHNSHFAKAKELLKLETLPYVAGNDNNKAGDTDAFTFFCVIGSQSDIDPDDVDVTDFCGGGATQYDSAGKDKNKYVADAALADEKSHYVRVRLRPNDNAPDNFSLNLIFLPVIEFFGGVTALREVSLGAEALAGRNWFVCDYPPMAICNPFEDPDDPGNSQSFDDAMEVGQSVKIKEKSGAGAWTPGNFGFLTLSGPGAGSVAEDLADETDLGCTPAIVTTKTGGNTGQTKSGLNTRFGIYRNSGSGDDWYDGEYGAISGGFTGSEDTYPPAPNVARYPADNAPNLDLAPEDRFGNGEWDCLKAWEDNHGTASLDPALEATGLCKANSNTPGKEWTRWDMYNWEIDNLLPGNPPRDILTYLQDEHHSTDNRDRRKFFVAVLDCVAHGFSGGKTTAPLFGNDGFAEMFLIRPATPPSDPDGATIFAEYLGWGDEDDDFIHVEVKLFE